MKIRYLLTLMILTSVVSSASADEDIYGVWKPTTYLNAGKELPVQGIMIITPEYFVANTTFDFDEDGVPEANANSGPITIEDGVIKLTQWMQLHWRVNSTDENFLRINVPEDIQYTIEDDRLVFHFSTGNKYISERMGAQVPN